MIKIYYLATLLRGMPADYLHIANPETVVVDEPAQVPPSQKASAEQLRHLVETWHVH